MAIDLPSNSRFRQTEVIKKNGGETFGLWSKPSFLTTEFPEDEIVKFEVTSPYKGRPDLIADEIYGDPQLAWVVIASNRTFDTINWPTTGMVLRLPPVSEVLGNI